MLEAIDIAKNLKIIIKCDPKVGYYIFVYNNTSEELIEDRLYDTLEEAFTHTKDLYGFDQREFIEK